METEKKVHISASQLETFRTCPRKWGWGYLAGIKQPASRSTDLGEAVHKILEDYYLQGNIPALETVWRFNDAGDEKAFYPVAIALPMMHAVPKREGMAIETTFNEAVAGVNFTGRVDMMYQTDDVLHIIDHKTTADAKKWGKTEEDLRNDAQCLLYSALGPAAWAKVRPAAPAVRVVHFALNYGATSGKAKDARLVQAMPTTVEAARLAFETQLLPLAQHMTIIKQNNATAESLQPTPAACEIFGGCPYKGLCNLSTADRLKGIVMKNTLIASLLAKSAAAPAAAPAVTAVTPSVNPPVEQQNAAPEMPAPEVLPAQPAAKKKTAVKLPAARVVTPAAPEPSEEEQKAYEAAEELAEYRDNPVTAEPAAPAAPTAELEDDTDDGEDDEAAAPAEGTGDAPARKRVRNRNRHRKAHQPETDIDIEGPFPGCVPDIMMSDRITAAALVGAWHALACKDSSESRDVELEQLQLVLKVLQG